MQYSFFGSCLGKSWRRKGRRGPIPVCETIELTVRVLVCVVFLCKLGPSTLPRLKLPNLHLICDQILSTSQALSINCQNQLINTNGANSLSVKIYTFLNYQLAQRTLSLLLLHYHIVHCISLQEATM